MVRRALQGFKCPQHGLKQPAYCFSSCGHLLIIVLCRLCEGAAFKLFPGSMQLGLAVISKRIIF